MHVGLTASKIFHIYSRICISEFLFTNSLIYLICLFSPIVFKNLVKWLMIDYSKVTS